MNGYQEGGQVLLPLLNDMDTDTNTQNQHLAPIRFGGS